LYDVVPEKLSARDIVVRTSEFYGEQVSRWNGVDVVIDARLRAGTFIGGGFSLGKTTTDQCDIVTKVDNPSTHLCHQETPFLANVKLQGSYALPWNAQVSATFQSLPGAAISATYTATNAQIAPSLGRNLAAGPNATAPVELMDPGTTYNERMYQVDMRLAKRFSIGRTNLQGQFDLYNLLNGNFVLSQNNTYGTTGTSWLRPIGILTARLLKFGVQVDF
jgi:hypothetical protein